MRIIFTLSICLFILTFSQTASSQEEVVVITRCALRPVNEIPVAFSIKDNVDNGAIKGATVSILRPYKNDTLRFAANDSGVVCAKFSELLASYTIKITAVGYEDTSFLLIRTGKHEVFLRRKPVEMQPVIIVDYVHIKCYRYSCCCSRIRGIKYSADTIEKNVLNSFPENVKYFPNPGIRGGSVTVEFEAINPGSMLIRIISMDGRLVSSLPVNAIKGKNRLQVAVDSRWTAGTYIFQLIYAKGSVAASGKVIIQ
jgi:hypothetical protein